MSTTVTITTPDSYHAVMEALGNDAVNTAIRTFSTVKASAGSAISYSSVGGSHWTINLTGIYAISYNDASSIPWLMGISRNSTQLNVSIGSIASAEKLALVNPRESDQQFSVGWIGQLVSGDVVRAHNVPSAPAPPSPGRTMFTITQIS